MVKSIMCHECKQDFVPDNEYVFPIYYVYWHECALGVLTQNIVVKEKKYCWREKEISKEKNLNRILMSFHNPLLWRNHDVTDEKQLQ